jgi:hypothetical protein
MFVIYIFINKVKVIVGVDMWKRIFLVTEFGGKN